MNEAIYSIFKRTIGGAMDPYQGRGGVGAGCRGGAGRGGEWPAAGIDEGRGARVVTPKDDGDRTLGFNDRQETGRR